MGLDSLKNYVVYTEGLQKAYKNIQAVKNVNLRIKKGEIFGLIGPDGAGKTSLIQMLCGLSQPTSGLIFINGHNVVTEPETIRKSIGYMSQDFTLYLDMTVDENIEFVAKLKGMEDDELEARKERLLEFSRMALFRGRRAGDLSGGMKKKLALSCALAHKPSVLILDEPTTAVDPISRGDLWRILYEFIIQGITVIISTPYMDEAERCTRVALVQDGEFLACDTPDNLKELVDKTIISFKSNNPYAACTALNETGDFNARIFGDQIRLSMDEDIQDISAIETCLRGNNGLEVHDLMKVRPNMDDVYINLLAKGSNNGKEKINWLSFNTGSLNKKAIKVSNVTKKFKSFVAVNNVSFEIDQGRIFGLLGPNGAGKTTIIKIMCGLHAPTSGKAVVAGYDIATQAKLVKRKIGYMSQLFSLYPDLTVEQNLDLYSSIYGIKRKEKKLKKEWAVELAGLKGREKYLTSELVGGWKQKLALGCAVMHQPSVLFLDEPTSGVDPLARQEFWDVIYRFSEEGITIVVTTHFMDEAERCNILGLMSSGNLITIAPPEDLKKGLPQDFYELKAADTLASFDKLLSAPYISQASLFGEKIHISSKMDTNELQNQILSDKALGIEKIEKIQPLLEDVFIHHVKENERLITGNYE